MAQICFEKNYFYTVMVVGLGIIAYAIHSIYQELLFDHRLKLMRENRHDTEQTSEQDPRDKELMQVMLASQAQRHEDIQRLVNPMIPPLRRGDFNYSGSMMPRVPVTVPTRGEYGSFQQNGYLYNKDLPDQAMPLMGRRIHSNQYEYYTFHHNNQQIKIPIEIAGKRQLNEGETISIPGYPQQFQVKIYELDSPRYIPY